MFNIEGMAEAGALCTLAWITHYLLTKVIPRQTSATKDIATEVSRIKIMLIRHHDASVEAGTHRKITDWEDDGEWNE